MIFYRSANLERECWHVIVDTNEDVSNDELRGVGGEREVSTQVWIAFSL